MRNSRVVSKLSSKVRRQTLSFSEHTFLHYDKAFSLRSSSCSSQRKEKHNMIRPLLELTRETITILCQDYKMPVYPDQSNRSVQYSRNRIRKQILPSIQYCINPKVENSLCKLAELLNNEQSFLYSIMRNTSEKMPLQE